MNKLWLSFLICLLVMPVSTYSQTAENVDYRIEGDKIYVTYDFSYYKEGKKYKVDLKFIDSNGKIIIPRTVEGDIGLIYGGNNKQVVWRVLQDIDEMTGEYKAVVTLTRQERQNHTIMFAPNLPWSFFGAKYAYISNVGAYVAFASDFGILDETVHITGGLAIPVAERTSIYFGGGMELVWQEPIVESGVILKFKTITIDLGAGINIFDIYYSYGKLGAGFSF